MFFLVFVLFTSRWSVRKVLDCFFNMHLCAKLQPYRSKFFLQFLELDSCENGDKNEIFFNFLNFRF